MNEPLRERSQGQTKERCLPCMVREQGSKTHRWFREGMELEKITDTAAVAKPRRKEDTHLGIIHKLPLTGGIKSLDFPHKQEPKSSVQAGRQHCLF